MRQVTYVMLRLRVT